MKALVFGIGSFAQVAAAYLDHDSKYRVAAFVVDERYIVQPELMGVPVVAFEHVVETHPPAEYEMFVAVGFKRVNALRAEMVARCKALGYKLLTYVSSRASIVVPVPIGENCFICENTAIQPFVTIGDDTILWGGSYVGHHSRIGAHCFLASHVAISGHVTIGDGCFIGVNATLRDGVTIPPQSVIGAGATMLSDGVERGVYKGAAAHPAQYTSDQLRTI